MLRPARRGARRGGDAFVRLSRSTEARQTPAEAARSDTSVAVVAQRYVARRAGAVRGFSPTGGAAAADLEVPGAVDLRARERDPLVQPPVLFLGKGAISIGHDVEFGWPTSGGFYSGYCHVEASAAESVVEIGDGAQLNNDALIKSEGPGIRIGPNALLGSRVCIYDSDFHELHPARRRGGRPAMAPVELEENVFIGDGVLILKGVTIGAHAVVGAGSVVSIVDPVRRHRGRQPGARGARALT